MIKEFFTYNDVKVSEYDLNEIKIELEEPNKYIKASDRRILSNLELLKR